MVRRAMVKSKSPLASVNSEKGKALRRICSNPKQASNRLLGRGDSGIDDGRSVAPCDRKSHRNCRVVDQPVLKSSDGGHYTELRRQTLSYAQRPSHTAVCFNILVRFVKWRQRFTSTSVE